MLEITKTSLKKSYERVKQKSFFDMDYNFMLVLSSIICFWGFKINSPSVIIGAMVISPMLYSVIGIASSLFFVDMKQFVKEIISLILEIIVVVMVVSIFGNIFSIEANTEITTKLYTKPIDYFFIALFSGIAGCFAIYWPKIEEVLVGIAISVALIPPIVLLGIGIAQLDIEVITYSSVIVLINIIGIVSGSLLLLFFLKIFQNRVKK